MNYRKRKDKRTIKNIDSIFSPKSIAVVGASRDKKSVGYGIAKNLIEGCTFKCRYCKPFKGKVYLVNPKAGRILGQKCYPNLSSIREKIDLVVIVVPAHIVEDIVKECVRVKAKGIIIISAGFAEIGKKGKEIQDKIASIASGAGIPIVGPNCLGIIRPSTGMNASFAPSTPPKGNVAFISQSGALADSIIDWAIEERYGFSTIISIGNQADLSVSDFVEWLGDDRHTKAIALYIEGIDDGRKFMKITAKVSKKKPIIVLKSGRTEKGQKAISSHTGSVAGSYQIYETAFRQCGIEVADNVEELFDLSKALANQPPCRKNSIAIVTNAGGPGVLCADFCESMGVKLAELKQSTIKKLDKSRKMHPAYSRHNPLDIVGDALPERYDTAINTLLSEDYISGLIVIQTLQTMTDPIEDAKIIIKAKKRFKDKPIICTYMGGMFSRKGMELLEANGIPDYNDPKKAARAMKALIDKGKKGLK